MSAWFENEDFWKSFYPFLFPPQRWQSADEEVQKILELTHLKEGAILDLCCGPGRHAVTFAKRGFQVTGVDISRFLLEKAKNAAEELDVEVEFIQGSMRDFQREDGFSLVISVFTSFGFFESREEDCKVIENVYRSLKPGGYFFMDLISKEVLAKKYQGTFSNEFEDGTIVIDRHKIVDDWDRTHNNWLVIKGNKVTNFEFFLNLYSGHELKELLDKAGFSKIQLMGNIEGGPFDNNATRLIALARK